jgi:PAS domain S-box-containing protein
MKDAMLSNMDIPVVGIWRDESAVFPNQAARKLFAVHADAASEQSYDFVSRFKAYTADFERELEEDENPMLTLCRTQKAFSNWKIGLVEPNTGKPKNFDVSGKPVVDERTGEFLVGLVAFKDVTEYTEKLASQSEENELQFQLICDTMPQMLWTTTAEGYHDYFSQRWYDYTGLSRERSLGMGWQLAFHPDDMQVTISRWTHSLATGDEYTTEYRCRRADGAWRWMLGRALPLRDVKTSKIAKWFGTCTDIQDLKSLEESNRQTHERLLEVLKHSQMSMWQVDREAHVTFFEGSTAAANTTTDEFKSQTIGRSLYEAFGSCTHDSDVLQASVDRMLRGESNVDIIETKTKDNSRWFRSKLVAQREHTGPTATGDKTIVGVVGISIEVTELKRKEEENMKLLTAEAAAKEANKMKSSFLANMSHEIRTPIAGIIGMSELIIDTDLNEEQNEFAQNIQRSANTLLTVINDILDFSKIESGRLDIEEVQFSLGVVLRDVSKMLSFAAERKKLLFQSDIRLGGHGDLIILGDPGRVRQILTNLCKLFCALFVTHSFSSSLCCLSTLFGYYFHHFTVYFGLTTRICITNE